MKNKKLIFIIILLTLISLLVVFWYRNVFRSLEKYTVVNGYIEKVSDSIGYLVRDEQKVNINESVVTTPIIEQYQRVAKNETIAVYKNNKYEEYTDQIKKMDADIETLIADLPPTYSNEISSIDSKISDIIKESKKTTSYVKMQEYKTKLDELAYKKVIILGQLSPAGSKIRELIAAREKLETQSKASADNIKATTSGIISYKIDDLEGKYNNSNILNYTEADFENMIKLYNSNATNKFGIKIINNYEAYIVVKKSSDGNDSFIKQGNTYNIKLVDSSVTISGSLVKIVTSGNNSYCIFKILNGIENFGDSREISIEVIWKKYTGMTVPIKSINNSQDGKYKYVRILKNSEYINIPVNVVASSDSIYIVSNLSKDEKAAIGLSSSSDLSVYDEVIVDEKK